MKKKIIVFFSLIGFVICLLVVLTLTHNYIVYKKNQEVIKQTSYYKSCEIINKYETNIMIYGKEERKFKYLSPTYIDDLSNIETSSQFNVLIVNDLYSETKMEDSDYQNIYNFINNNSNKLMFIYYGNLKFDKLREFGLLKVNIIGDTLGIFHGPFQYSEGCFYFKSDFSNDELYPNLFEECFAYLIVDEYIKKVI